MDLQTIPPPASTRKPFAVDDAPRDYRDLVIEQFAADEQQLLERLASVAVYRDIALATFDALRALTVRQQRLQASYNELKHAYRHLRERCLLNTEADA